MQQLLQLSEGPIFSYLLLNNYALIGRSPQFWQEKAIKSTRTSPLFQTGYLPSLITGNSQKYSAFHKPRFIMSVTGRYKIVDDLLKEKSQDNDNKWQIINIGCGFSPLHLNHINPHHSYFQLDTPSTIQMRKQLFQAKEIKLPSHSIGVSDYLKPNTNLLQYFNEAGVDFKRPTLFLWLGGSAYTPKPQTALFFNQLIYRFDKFQLIIDQQTPQYIEEVQQLQAQWKLKDKQMKIMESGYDADQFAKVSGLVMVKKYGIFARLRELGVGDLDDQPGGYQKGDKGVIGVYRNRRQTK